MPTFQKINLTEFTLPSVPFLSVEWRKFFQTYFSDFEFEGYVYDEAFILVTVFHKQKKTRYSLPFVDVGGIFRLVPGKKLDILLFDKDARAFFQNETFHVHSGYCPTEGEMITDLVDFRIPLIQYKNKEELFASLRKTLRHILQKAPDFMIEESYQDPREIKILYRLYCQTMREKMNIVLPFALFHFLVTTNTSGLLLARKGKKIIGFSLFLDILGSTHYYLSSTDKHFRDLHVTHHLVWHRLAQDLGDGKKYFYLGGTRKDGSLETFKKAWTSDMVPIYKISSQSDTQTSFRQSRVRRLWRWIPLFLLPKVSTYVVRKIF